MGVESVGVLVADVACVRKEKSGREEGGKEEKKLYVKSVSQSVPWNGEENFHQLGNGRYGFA